MSTAKRKPANNQSRPLNRNPMSFSMRQKKKERSEVRNNASCSDSSPPLSAHEECPSPIQFGDTEDMENLSPVMEETATHPSPTTQTSAILMPATPKHLPRRLDPAAIFPYSNKPHETRKKTIAEESKQWESLFDPQHTFGSFQTSIAKPVSSQQYFYKGKWPLDQEDILGMVPKPRKSLHHRQNSATATPNMSIMDREGASTAAFAFPTVPSPTLPDKKQLELHINPVLQDNENDMLHDSFPRSSSQIEILPCPSLTQFPKYRKSENETLWKDRLELLKKIQHQGFRQELNGTLNTGNKESAAVRLQRQLKRKAEKIKRETLVDSSTEEEDEDDDEDEHNCNIANATEDGTLLVAVEPDTMLVDFSSTQNKEEQDTASSLHTTQPYESSLVSLDDEWENISFKPPCSVKEIDEENQASKQEEAVEIKRRNRPTFLLFAYGFLFPPLWIIGALYNPSSSLQRTTSSKKIDRKWKNYSRNAFFVFIVIAATLVVLILVLKPQAVGFRSSSDQIYPEERIVFDENDAHNIPAVAAAAVQQQL